MTDSQLDISASIGASYGLNRVEEQTRTGVVFRRHSQTQSDLFNSNLNPIAHGDGSDAYGGAGRMFKDTVVDHHEKILLPQSTHSLLFTENVFSLPFGFAFFVLFVSFMCLGLALWDNLSGGSPGNPLNVPVNVFHQVRLAQHLSILIAIIMEEEIPTATYLLRMIPRSSVEKMGLSYTKFVFSATSRLIIGFLFLCNVFIAVVQSDRVLEMFYDMLALNFVALVDDMAFKLAKYDVLGKHLRNAASAKYFHVEFEKRPFLFRKKMTIFVKFVYIFVLLLCMAGLTTISIMQRKGNFQCKSVTVMFGEEIWENAWVESSPGQSEQMLLVYSYFNGVYKQIGDNTKSGRPVYTEMRKSTDTQFETKTGAEISYCGGAWVLTHEHIRKSMEPEESDCPWLLRSADTQAFDLLEVSGRWNIWVGTINDDASIKITCNGCISNTDCNLNGKCGDDGKCDCTRSNEHYGLHCELEDPCQHLTLGRFNDTWSMVYRPSQNYCEPVLLYSRPVYALTNNDVSFKQEYGNEVSTFENDDMVALIYAGSRWFVMKIRGGKTLDSDFIEHKGEEFHAFWDRAYDNGTIVVSDSTTKSYPIGVDTYRIGERGPQYGPLGVLYPMQDPPGKGAFRCLDIAPTYSAGTAHLLSLCHSRNTFHMSHYHWEA